MWRSSLPLVPGSGMGEETLYRNSRDHDHDRAVQCKRPGLRRLQITMLECITLMTAQL